MLVRGDCLLHAATNNKPVIKMHVIGTFVVKVLCSVIISPMLESFSNLESQFRALVVLGLLF